MNPPVASQRPVLRSRKYRSWAIFISSILVSAICLIWVLTGADLGQIWGDVREMDWRWFCIAVAADCCVYLLHGWRWKLMLAPIEKIRFLHSVEAIYIGLFANEVLPLRAGELIRCFLLSKSTELPISVTFASALIERIFDGVWLMVCFFFALHMGAMPKILAKFGYVLGGMIVVLAVIVGFGMYAKKTSLDLIFGWSWPRWFNTLIDDLHLIGHSRYLYYSFLLSGAYLLAQMVPIFALVQANDLDVPWAASFTMMVLLRLSSVIPQAPGNLGLFQWVTAATLISMFHLADPLAKRFSLILWAGVTLPLIVIGSISLAFTGISMSHLHKQAAAAANNRRVA